MFSVPASNGTFKSISHTDGKTARKSHERPSDQQDSSRFKSKVIVSGTASNEKQLISAQIVSEDNSMRVSIERIKSNETAGTGTTVKKTEWALKNKDSTSEVVYVDN